jgi:hypothetical protein
MSTCTDRVCAACAMTAAAGATGVRTWLQTRGWAWLTPKRLKHATVVTFVAATLVSALGLSGSTHPAPSPHSNVAVTQR